MHQGAHCAVLSFEIHESHTHVSPFCQNGDTPLHLAAGHGHFDVVERLLGSFETRDEINMVGDQ